MANLPPQLLAQLQQARSKIPPTHYNIPVDSGVVADPLTAFQHLNDYAFLHGQAYVKLGGSLNERRYRYACIYHTRAKRGERTQNSRRLKEEDRHRGGTFLRGMGCPVGVTISL